MTPSADPFDIAGRVALVTGASSGIGRHLAGVLARRGAPVALAARRLDRLESLAAGIEAEGGRALPVALDVTDAGSIRAAFDAAEQALGPVRILLNNSGVAGAGRAVDVDESEWDRILDTNLRGAFLVAREAARRMIEAGGGGSIVNVASILALRVAGGVAPYAASKAGLLQLTRALALELARDAIRVNAIAPGYVETDINREFLNSERGRALVERVPQRRTGCPEDLEGAVLLLASDASAYMTGATVVVDGGHLCSGL